MPAASARRNSPIRDDIGAAIPALPALPAPPDWNLPSSRSRQATSNIGESARRTPCSGVPASRSNSSRTACRLLPRLLAAARFRHAECHRRYSKWFTAAVSGKWNEDGALGSDQAVKNEGVVRLLRFLLRPASAPAVVEVTEPGGGSSGPLRPHAERDRAIAAASPNTTRLFILPRFMAPSPDFRLIFDKPV